MTNSIKVLMFLTLIANLTGCATMGNIMQGAGQGLQNSSNNRAINCTTNVVGSTYSTNCR